MIEAGYFDKLEAVARHVRKSQQPFGGIQLILCGDFLQLPPVLKDQKITKKFCFQVVYHICIFFLLGCHQDFLKPCADSTQLFSQGFKKPNAFGL